MKRILVLLVLAAVAHAQDKPEPAFRIEGQVVDAKDKARSGALVSLWDALDPARFLGKTETNALGRFVIDVARETAGRREHPYGHVIVEVKGGGGAQLRIDARAGASDLKIRSAAAKKIEGVVETQQGKPVPAAVVIATRGGVTEKTTTDENGRYVLVQFTDVPKIRVIGEGCVVHPKSLRVVMPTTTVGDYRLVGEHGKPLVGVRIRNGMRDVAVTDEQGVYRVPRPIVVPGRKPSHFVAARLRVHAKGYDAAWLSGKSEQEIAAAEPLRGVVVSSAGKSVPNARVSIREMLAIWPPVLGERFVAWTDPLGGFRFDALPRGMVDLTATAPGYLPAEVRVEAGIAADRITLRLIEGKRIAGRVMRAGQPAMGAWVIALAGEEPVATAYSDAKGRFQMSGIPPGATHLRAGELGRRSVRTALKDGVTLDLEDRMRLFGVLVSDTGEPLAGLKVGSWLEGSSDKPREITTGKDGRFDFGVVPVFEHALAGAPAHHEPLHTMILPGEEHRVVVQSRFGKLRLKVWPDLVGNTRMHVRLERLEKPRVTRSGVGTNYSFAYLPPGKYRVTIRAEGHLEYVEEFQLDRSRTLRPALQRGGTLELVATPGAKVIVQTLSGKPAPIIVMSLAAGKKTVRGFGPGEYRFISRAKGELIVVRLVRLGPNAKPEKLDLRGGKESTLTVTVKDGAGDPVVGAKIVIESGGFAAPPKRADEHGKVTLTRLFSGRVRVTASHGERTTLQEIVIEPGKQLTLDLTLG